MKNQKLLLMNKDIPVMEVNYNDLDFTVINEKSLPFQLKNKIKKFEGELTLSNVGEIAKIKAKNGEAFTNFLAQRILPITRENAKKIYALFNFEQAQDDYSKAKVAIVCRAVSLQDNYWVKLENDPVSWADVDLRTNHLNEVVAQVALHGSSLTLTGNPITPELTVHGAYAKAWKRDEGKLFLYKKSSTGNNESAIEIMVSNLLDKMNVYHVPYFKAEQENCCKCECMTSSNVSILSAMDFESYCNIMGKSFINEIKKMDKEGLYKMMIVDYLIANRDRHGMNWGLYYNSETMKFMGLHPLYDHNNAFDEEYMKTPDAKYLAIPSMTTREAAIYAIKRTDFHFTDAITREDFITNEQYVLFSQRANELNIQLIKADKDLIKLNKIKERVSKGIPFTKELRDELVQTR